MVGVKSSLINNFRGWCKIKPNQ